MKKILVTLGISATLILSSYYITYNAVKNAGTDVLATATKTHVVGSAPLGTMNQLSTTSTISVGPQQNKLLFAGNTVCSSRVISTGPQPVMLMFDSTTTFAAPSNTIGHIQLSSTTQSYPSETWGCGPVTAFGISASSTLNISEFK